jgi:protein subunit release factor B
MDCFNHRENALATLTVRVGGGFATTIYKKFVGIHQLVGEDPFDDYQ